MTDTFTRAQSSPRQRAVKRVCQSINDKSGVLAEYAVEDVFAELRDPDRDMIDAGLAELERALPAGTSKIYRRQLARVIWNAMLDRAG
jgi:predicted transcriptional regulator